MKRNYAFVQFETVEEASRAKDATNGGKLDQSEITVEFVARRMGEGGRRDRGRKFCLGCYIPTLLAYEFWFFSRLCSL